MVAKIIGNIKFEAVRARYPLPLVARRWRSIFNGVETDATRFARGPAVDVWK